ncbi:MBL fold metallo-hydrolase [Dactylosporangium siamense]|uniref:MBL fold metallo-hydrolase n=1 Tax=Dactylosporangium siamense TaxID=685454 RepID=A0A919PH84_9ACTN|nr:MBL fold metallo-hydrolase [Dactylosporangium siamense]GIG43609.1 MBL fold metallo-hydrolase [Dactylosporangium siamense]
MRLTVLGCAGSFPGPEAPCSAYLVEADGFRLLVDFGPGSMSTLQRFSGLYNVDAILLTHLHCDHMLDACSYIVARRYAPSGPLPPLPVYAPVAAPERISAAYGGENEPMAISDVYTFYALQPGSFPIGPLHVTVDRVNHPIETYGVRIEHEGRVITYSADTAACDQLIRLAQGADLFLCEASYLDGADNPPDLHLTGREAAEHATKAEVGRLLLTHLVPAWGSEALTLEAAQAAFEGPIDIVRPGARYDI